MGRYDDNAEPRASPGLGGIYVTAPYRQRGVGITLIKAGMALARELEYSVLYAGSASAHRLFERLGWLSLRMLQEGQDVDVRYRYEFCGGCAGPGEKGNFACVSLETQYI